MKVESIHLPRRGRLCALPLMGWTVRAGFPSPAADYLESPLDLNAHLIRNRPSTFFVRAVGDSMDGVGIRDGALLIVDRAVQARDGSIVIAIVSGELTVKRLRRGKDLCHLEAANSKYPPIAVTSDDAIWGVVTHAINAL